MPSLKNDVTLTMRNSMAGLIELIKDANVFLDSLPLPPNAMYKANLVLEEILTNIIKYGVRDTEEHEITVIIALRDAQLVLEFLDDGIEFDPLSVSPPEVLEPVEERDVGGLGIHLVKKTAEWIEYHRAGEKNILRIGITWD
jgi:serine/threonine-protein kinase RsbW